MDTRNLDEEAYRALHTRAVSQGRDVDDLLNEAIRAYLVRVPVAQQGSTLRDLVPEAFPEGNERLSQEIDAIVYSGQRP